MLRWILLASLFAGACLLAPRTAAAFGPYVTVTNCEQVTVGGQPAVRLTLTFLAKSGGFFEVAVQPPYGPTYPDTCSVLDGAGPPGWTFYRDPNGICLWEGSTYVQDNESLGGFQLVLNRMSCCKSFMFENGLLLDEPSTTVCFENCLATPSRGASWGQIKAIYR